MFGLRTLLVILPMRRLGIESKGVRSQANPPSRTAPGGLGDNQELQYERLLLWLYAKQQQLGDRLFVKPTDAPHYMRVVRQQAKLSHSPAGWVPAPADHWERTEETCLVCH